MKKKTVIIQNNQNRDKPNDDLQKFLQTSEQILRTLDVMMKMRSHYYIRFQRFLKRNILSFKVFVFVLCEDCQK